MSDNPEALRADIKAAVTELAEGRKFPDLLEAIDQLAALAQQAATPRRRPDRQPEPTDLTHYRAILDIWAEANAVDTVLGSRDRLLAKVTRLRDAMGAGVPLEERQAATPAPAEPAGWFARNSEYGPWIECKPGTPGAVRFYAAPPAEPDEESVAADAYWLIARTAHYLDGLVDELHGGKNLGAADAGPLVEIATALRACALRLAGLRMKRAAPPAAQADPPNADEVICPACAHQFRAIPENVQRLLLDAGFEPPFTQAPAAQAGDAWISVEDLLPGPDAGEVLVWSAAGRWALDEWNTQLGEWRHFDDVTHWQPPLPPRAAKGQPEGGAA